MQISQVSSNPKLFSQNINLCLAVFCNFLGEFGGCFEKNSFTQRISKIWTFKRRINALSNDRRISDFYFNRYLQFGTSEGNQVCY